MESSGAAALPKMQAPTGGNAAQRLRAFGSDALVSQHAFHAHTATGEIAETGSAFWCP